LLILLFVRLLFFDSIKEERGKRLLVLFELRKKRKSVIINKKLVMACLASRLFGGEIWKEKPATNGGWQHCSM